MAVTGTRGVDVLVVGGGLAGVVAALAARAEGAQVALARRSWGATALSTGAWDLCWQPPLGEGTGPAQPLRAHLADLVAHRPRHPLARLGLEQASRQMVSGHQLLVAGLAAGDEPAWSLEPGPVDLDRPHALVVSSLGAVLPAATAAASHLGLPLAGRWGLAALDGLGQVNGPRVVGGATYDLARMGVAGLDFTLVRAELRAVSSFAAAAALEQGDAIEQLARSLAPQLAGKDGVVVPPVLGLAKHREVRARLARALGLPVVEMAGHLPSVPGLRLQRALDRAVDAAEIEVLGGQVAARLDEQRLAEVVGDDGAAVRPGAVVLASGRFIAGGVATGRRAREALIGLPVASELGAPVEVDPVQAVRPDPGEAHPLMTCGLQVNERLQPLTDEGEALANVFAAGMVLGGFAARFCRSADGVALATGAAAGQAAALAAGRAGAQ